MPEPRSKFVQGIIDMGAVEDAKRFTAIVRDMKKFTEALTEGVTEFGQRHRKLGESLEKIEPERRADVLGLQLVGHLGTDAVRAIDFADEIIRQAHRLKEIASRELCEDWIDTQLDASIKVIKGGAA